jgi:serine/threonine protein kinase
MAKVWRGIHQIEQVPVAVKLVKGLAGAAREALEQFRHEARAHAGLEHTNIVRLLDFGETDAPLTSGALSLPHGTPYLAMEYAAHGTLQDHRPPADWETLRGWLDQLLDGLAFAHARDVIHRDLKPENVLAFRHDKGPLTLKLSDFGLARSARSLTESDATGTSPEAGTPYYMAPEQLRAEWRRFGPWTDLYQLGAVTWDLVTGRPPFHGSTLMEIAVGHLEGELPDFRPLFPVPDQLGPWLRGLLCKEPTDRFQRAADAQSLLAELEAPTTGPSDPSPPRQPSLTLEEYEPRASTHEQLAETQPLDRQNPALRATLPETLEDAGGPQGEASPETSEAADALAPAAAPPPLPDTWRRESNPRVPLPMVGAGLGLFDLREVPFVDRTSERDTIWQALQSARSTDSPRLVLVEGSSGTGKSRLVQWMAHRAHELGGCTLLPAAHDRNQPGTAGLVDMVERLFRTWELDRREVAEQIDDWLEGWTVSRGSKPVVTPPNPDALTEWVRPSEGTPDCGPPYRFDSETEQFSLLTDLTVFLAQPRPLVVWLDDIQWSRKAVDWLEFALGDTAPARRAPILFLATARTDDETHAATDNLDTIRELTAQRGGSRLSLPPLSSEDHARFVDRLIALEPDISGRVQQRTEGNPLFAVQLVGDWIERGWLEAGEAGFVLGDEADVALPDAIHALWRRRLDRVFASLEAPDSGQHALELAAALGRHVDHREWQTACQLAGIAIPEQLREGLLAAGLLEEQPGGFSFVHRMLVESLGRIAREAGRWSDHHRACATMIGRRGRGDPEERSLRRADHFQEAGDLHRAIDVIGRALPRLRGRIAYERHRRALDRRSELMDALAIPDDDIRRVRNQIERATLQLNRDIERAGTLVEQLGSTVRTLGNSEDLARLLLVNSAVTYHRGRPEECAQIHNEIAALLEDSGASRLRGRLCYQRSFLATADRDPEAATDWVERAVSLFEANNDQGWIWRAKVRHFPILLAGGDDGAIAERARATIEEAQSAGSSMLEGVGQYYLGIALIRMDRWSEAADALDQAGTLYRRVGSRQDETKNDVQRVIADLGLGAEAAAEQRLDRLADKLDAQNLRTLAPFVPILRATIAGRREEWTNFDRALDRYEADCADIRPVPPPLIDAVERLCDEVDGSAAQHRVRRVESIRDQLT